MCFEIRRAVRGDLSDALKLDREAFGADSWTLLDYIGVFSISRVKKFTAVVDGKFAGFAASEFSTERQAACLMTLAVRPEYRRRGIGSALLKRCEEAFDVSFWFLNVDTANTEAIRLYERAGYRMTGVDHAYYNNGHDALIMEKNKKQVRG